MQHFQIKLSRATPKVKSKIFQLLHRQEANLVFNPDENLYHVDLKIASTSRLILDQITRSLTETVEQTQDCHNEYSFSRVLDPLDIYEGNMKADSKVNFDVLQEQISEAIDDSFTKARERMNSKHQRSPNNPESTTSAEFKRFLQRKISSVRKVSLQIPVITEEASQQVSEEEEEQKWRQEPDISISRVIPKKISLQTSGSDQMLSYFKKVIRGQR